MYIYVDVYYTYCLLFLYDTGVFTTLHYSNGILIFYFIYFIGIN